MTRIGLSDTTELREKIVKVDDKRAVRYKVVEEVVDLEAMRENLENVKYNIQSIQAMIDDIRNRLVSTDNLDPQQKQAVEYYNDSLALKRYEQELIDFTTKQTEIEAFLKEV